MMKSSKNRLLLSTQSLIMSTKNMIPNSVFRIKNNVIHNTVSVITDAVDIIVQKKTIAIPKNIFIYWTGPKPRMIKELESIMEKNLSEYNLIKLNESNVTEYIDIPSRFHKLIPAHQADFVRVACIAKYGGIYVDADTIVMKDFGKLFEINGMKDGFFVQHHDGQIMNSIFGSHRDTKLMKRWLKYINEYIENNEKLEWNDIGSVFLGKSYNRGKLGSYLILNGEKNIMPVFCGNVLDEFINKPYENYRNIERTFQPVVCIFNSVYNTLESMPDADIYRDKMPISYFMKKAKNTQTGTNKI